MERTKSKRNLVISAIALILAIAATTKIVASDEVRDVTILAIFGAGMAAGVLLVNVVMMRRNK